MNPVFSKLGPSLPPAVLMFNFRDDARTASICAYLKRQGIETISVLPCDYGRTIGDLLSLPGHSAQPPVFHPVPSFSDEMLVMSGFSQDELQAFLAFFRAGAIKRVSLKAMLTPSNAGWIPAQLHDHLEKEREQLEQASKSRGRTVR